MTQPYVTYADVCCRNRPLDDSQQSRVKLEAEAMLSILQRCEDREWSLLSSDAIRFEIARNTDSSKQEQLEATLSIAQTHLSSTPEIEASAQELIQLGFKLYDALHLAFAQSASVDIFLTTDDRLLRKAKQYPEVVTIPVENPVVWLMKLLQEENVNNETS
jgi:predicted nucleic acid-binding protein